MNLVIYIINGIYWILVVLIFARFVLSWIRPDPYHPILGPLMRIVYQTTEPLLAPIRKVLPAGSGLDFSPMILLLGIYFIRDILIRLLQGL